MIKTFIKIFLFAFPFLFLSCKNRTSEMSYFPLKVGNSWSYEVTSDIDEIIQKDKYFAKVDRIIEHENKDVYVRRIDAPGNIGFEYWITREKSGFFRIAQRVDSEPIAKLDRYPRMVLKRPLELGAAWMVQSEPFAIGPKNNQGQQYLKMPKIMFTYNVVKMNQSLTVNAGEFNNCVLIEGNANLSIYVGAVRGRKDVPIINREWYCKGIGLVKLERIEDLRSDIWTGGKIVLELLNYKIK